MKKFKFNDDFNFANVNDINENASIFFNEKCVDDMNNVEFNNFMNYLKLNNYIKNNYLCIKKNTIVNTSCDKFIDDCDINIDDKLTLLCNCDVLNFDKKINDDYYVNCTLID